MAEVPDYLLQRSRDRRSALGLGGDDGGGDAAGAATADAGASTSPATATEGAAPAPVGKAPVPVAPGKDAEPAPPSPSVAAALSRKRIPLWAMPVLLVLPIWAWVYALTLDPASDGELSITEIGATGYGACASCHGAAGGGGTGPAFADGAILETFPTISDHAKWVVLGSDGWRAEVGDTYGANQTAVGASGNVMPAFSTLPPEELLAVVIHEREQFGGEDPVEAGYLNEEGELLVELDEEGNVVDLDGNIMGGEGGATEAAAAEG